MNRLALASISDDNPPLIHDRAATIDLEWKKGSIFDLLGCTKWKCPYCGSHLATNKISLVCLSGCSLNAPEYRALINLTLPK